MSRTRTVRPKGSGYITPEGERRMRKELAFLWHEERPKVVKGVAEAAAEGDRSENAEYIYGKKRLREIDRRVQFLSRRLDELKVAESTPLRESDQVFFGAWVEVEDAEGERARHRIVGPDEFDMEPGNISMDSPVGRALMQRRVGDEVLVRRPRGETYLEILEVRYRPFDED